MPYTLVRLFLMCTDTDTKQLCRNLNIELDLDETQLWQEKIS